jgi:hypothetical protein
MNSKRILISNLILKLKILLILIIINFVSIESVVSQAVGDFGSVANTSWSIATTWKKWDGIGFNTVTATPPTTIDNVWITTGRTVTLPTSPISNCKNLTVQATAKLWANSAAQRSIIVTGNILCDGTIGNGSTIDGVNYVIEGANCTISGTGAFDASRVRKSYIAYNLITNLIIDMNLNLRWTGTQLYNDTEGTSAFTATSFNVTLNAGRTLNLIGTMGAACIDGTSGAANAPGADKAQSGVFTINGTLNIDGKLILKSYNPTPGICSWVIGSTGILRTASIDAAASSSDAPPAGTNSLTINSGGRLIITGTAAFIAFSTTNNTYNLNSGSFVEYSALGDQVVQSGLNYSNLNLSGSGNKNTNGNLTIGGNLIISTSAKLVPLTASSVSIAGNWTNYGVAGFTEGTSTVIFNGNTAQAIGGGVSDSFYNLSVNNSSTGVTVNNLSYVINNLTLTDGNFNTSGLNRIAMNNGSSVTGGSDTSFVNGPVFKAGNTAFTFPTGKNGKYQPLSISAPFDPNDAFEAQFFDQDPNVIYSGSKSFPLDHISQCDYWVLDRNAGFSDVNVTLFWQNNSTECPINDFPTLAVARYNGSNWVDEGNSSTTGSFVAGTITSNTVTSFSPFALGSLDPILNPLPVELLYFDAKNDDDNNVLINWATATEINNDYFVIERASKNLVFEPIETFDGSGNSTQMITYSMLDTRPLLGENYYRLKQIDYNGDFTYSEIKYVFNKSNKSGFAATVLNDHIEVLLSSLTKGKFDIIDITGKIIFTSLISEGQKNNFKPNSRGLYFVRFTNGKFVETIKLVY